MNVRKILPIDNESTNELNTMDLLFLYYSPMPLYVGINITFEYSKPPIIKEKCGVQGTASFSLILVDNVLNLMHFIALSNSYRITNTISL